MYLELFSIWRFNCFRFFQHKILTMNFILILVFGICLLEHKLFSNAVRKFNDAFLYWKNELDSMLTMNLINISISPQSGIKNLSGYARKWKPITKENWRRRKITHKIRKRKMRFHMKYFATNINIFSYYYRSRMKKMDNNKKPLNANIKLRICRHINHLLWNIRFCFSSFGFLSFLMFFVCLEFEAFKIVIIISSSDGNIIPLVPYSKVKKLIRYVGLC